MQDFCMFHGEDQSYVCIFSKTQNLSQAVACNEPTQTFYFRQTLHGTNLLPEPQNQVITEFRFDCIGARRDVPYILT